MTEGYTKLFNTIITSSIWSEDDKTRILWVTMLALSDFDGKVLGAIPGIANAARMSITDCEKSLDRLMSPDPYSRTPDEEGRRIRKIDGGWLIINHAKYRDNRGSRAEYFRDWRDKRAQQKRNKAQQKPVARNQDATYTDTDTDTDTNSVTCNILSESISQSNCESVENNTPKRFKKPTIEEISVYCKSINYELDAQYFFDYNEARGWMIGKNPMKSWQAAVRTWKRNDDKRHADSKPNFDGITRECEETEFDDILFPEKQGGKV